MRGFYKKKKRKRAITPGSLDFHKSFAVRTYSQLSLSRRPAALSGARVEATPHWRALLVSLIRGLSREEVRHQKWAGEKKPVRRYVEGRLAGYGKQRKCREFTCWHSHRSGGYFSFFHFEAFLFFSCLFYLKVGIEVATLRLEALSTAARWIWNYFSYQLRGRCEKM